MRKNPIPPLLLIFFILLLCLQVQFAETGTSRSSAVLNNVTDEFWHFLVEDSPYSLYFKQKLGLEISRLPEPGIKKAKSAMRRVQALLRKLRDIKPDEISYDERLTLEIMEWEMKNLVRGHEFFWLNIPITMYSSPVPETNRLFSEFRFQEKKHLGQYRNLLNLYPAFVEDILTILKNQAKRKIILPIDAIKLSLSYLNSLIQPPDRSIFYISESRLDALSLTPQEITGFQKYISGVISSRLNPGLKRLLDFIKGDYLKAAPVEVGLWQYPQGRDYYRFLVEVNTSLDLTPEEIHQTGLTKIKELKGELDEVCHQVRFRGTVDEFLVFLKNDPRFKAVSAEEMGKRMTRFKELAEARLPRLFSKPLQAPCEIRRLDPLLEGTMTFGYYQAPSAAQPTGTYFYNASSLENKNRLNTSSAALVLHELVPGHHFQINLQSENQSLPLIRRLYFLTPYAEGWAEYASRLGLEMNIYQDPYEHCGMIMEDMFMSVRLVVDTGMNYFQWPREKAKDFMKAHLLLSDYEIETETLRYSTDIPAQALAYKIGSLKMWELRSKARKILHHKFNIKLFHDALLDAGTLPLFLLEKHIDHFIEQKKTAKN